jgi:hypothetical protein
MGNPEKWKEPGPCVTIVQGDVINADSVNLANDEYDAV